MVRTLSTDPSTRHILLISYFFPPAYSGEATYSHDLAEGLITAGCAVTLLTAHLPGLEPHLLPSWVHLVPEPPINRLSDFERYRLEFTKNAIALSMSLSRTVKWNLIHCQEWFGAEAAIYLSRHFSVPLIKTVHFIPPRQLQAESGRWELANHWQNRTCKAASSVIAVSNHVSTSLIEEYDMPSQKISVVHNGVDPNGLESATSRSMLSKRYPALSNKLAKFILLSGRLVDQKGIDILIESIPMVRESYKNVSWIVCGGSSSGAAAINHYSKLAQSCEHSIAFTGHIPRADALGLARLASIVVAPSRFEPFGLSVLEAMFFARPIVASAVGGHTEMIIDLVSGLLLPPQELKDGCLQVNAKVLAEAQIRLLLDPDWARLLGVNARERARTLFSFENFIRGTLLTYEGALRHTSGKACT